MLEHLFGSKTRLKLLRLFFHDSDKAYFVRELTRILDVQINAIRRELELLLAAELIQEVETPATDTDTSAGLRKYYRLNRDSILYPELQALLTKAQFLGEQELVKELQNKGNAIRLLLLTGRFVGEPGASSDILIVGAVDDRAVARLIAKYEKEFGFEIRYTLMTEQEFLDRRHIMDKFIYGLFEGNHVKVVNELGV